MNDVTSLGIFIACLITTFGLLRMCEWLRPPEKTKSGSGTAALMKEARP